MIQADLLGDKTSKVLTFTSVGSSDSWQRRWTKGQIGLGRPQAQLPPYQGNLYGSQRCYSGIQTRWYWMSLLSEECLSHSSEDQHTVTWWGHSPSMLLDISSNTMPTTLGVPAKISTCLVSIAYWKDACVVWSIYWEARCYYEAIYLSHQDKWYFPLKFSFVYFQKIAKESLPHCFAIDLTSFRNQLEWKRHFPFYTKGC